MVMKRYRRNVLLILSALLSLIVLSSCNVREAEEEEIPSASAALSSYADTVSVSETQLSVPETTTVTTAESTFEDTVSSDTETSPAETVSTENTDTQSASAVTDIPATAASEDTTAASADPERSSDPGSDTESKTGSSAENVSSVTSYDEGAPDDEPEEVLPVSDEPVPYVPGDDMYRPYSYKFLDEKSLYVYDAIMTAAYQRKTWFPLSSVMNLSSEDYCAVYQLIYNDENAMFYLDTKMQYAVNSSTKNVTSANLFYKYSDEKIASMQGEIDAEVGRILAEITPEMTEYDIVKLFYDYLAENVLYDEEAENCRDIYGVFVDKKAICGGYAKAFSYLCGKAGIETLTITGDADEVPHMWNMVKLGGEWYHIDPTYAVTESKLGPYVRYDYFCVSDEVTEKSREVYEQNYEYPKATAEEYNYYVKNGLIANSWDEVQAMLTDQVIAAAGNRELVAQIRCGSQEVYDTSVYNLFDRFQAQAITLMKDALGSVENKYQCDNISYSQDDNTYVIKLFLEYTD